MKKRGKILLKILSLIKEGVVDMVDLQRAIISAGYGSSFGTIDWEYAKIKRNREISNFKKEAVKEKERRLSKYFWKLKRDGLIQEQKSGQLRLTKKGESALNDFSRNNYQKEASKNLIIVSFDIPESLRRGRNILRENLKLLGFNMVHQSTWFGKNKIPPKLLRELEKIGILEYIKIFEVTKKGTLIDNLP